MNQRIVSRDEWLAARKAHLANEKELTRLRDQLSAERRAYIDALKADIEAMKKEQPAHFHSEKSVTLRKTDGRAR